MCRCASCEKHLRETKPILNMDRKKIKGLARHNLLGHYGCVVGALIIVGIFNTIASYFAELMGVGSIIVGVVGYLLFLLVGLVLNAGYGYVHLLLARGRQTKVGDMFYTVRNQPKRFVAYGILYWLVSMACLTPGVCCLYVSQVNPIGLGRLNILAVIGVPAIAVGAIILIRIMLAWSMTVYVMLDKPNAAVMEAIRESRQMMRGNKGRLFALLLSFVGWWLFSVLTFFLALLWIRPYMTQSMVCFYISLLPPEQQAQGVGAES